MSVFVAFDDAESWTLFTAQAGLGAAVEFRLNYVLNAVHKHLVLNSSPPMLSPIEGYDTQYEYSYNLSKQANYGYMMVNSRGSKAYKININQKLIKYTGEWSIREIEEWE